MALANSIGQTLSQTIDQNIMDSLTSSTYGTTLGTHTHASGSSTFRMPEPTSLTFDIEGETVEFSGKELIRLKQMLTEYITENFPEDNL